MNAAMSEVGCRNAEWPEVRAPSAFVVSQEGGPREIVFLCSCGASHCLGPMDGVNVFRCLRCGSTTCVPGFNAAEALGVKIKPPKEPGAVGASAAPAPGDSHVSGLQIAADLALSAITNFAYFVAAAQPGELRSSDALRAARDIERAARGVVDALAGDADPTSHFRHPPSNHSTSERRSTK